MRHTLRNENIATRPLCGRGQIKGEKRYLSVAEGEKRYLKGAAREGEKAYLMIGESGRSMRGARPARAARLSASRPQRGVTAPGAGRKASGSGGRVLIDQRARRSDNGGPFGMPDQICVIRHCNHVPRELERCGAHNPAPCARANTARACSSAA